MAIAEDASEVEDLRGRAVLRRVEGVDALCETILEVVWGVLELLRVANFRRHLGTTAR